MINPLFEKYFDQLEEKLNLLSSMKPVKATKLPPNTPTGGIYLFSENDMPLYCGRTKHKIKTRVTHHFSFAKDCPLAFKLAREDTGNINSSYSGEGTRKALLSDSKFKEAYKNAKNRIRDMDVRYIEEKDPIKQTLLEIYVSVILKTRYNDFETH